MPNSKFTAADTVLRAGLRSITSPFFFLVIFLAALTACSSTPPPPDTSVVLRNQAADQIALARADLARNAYENAKAYARAALYISESVDDSRGVVNALLVLGSVEARQNNSDVASGLFARALEVTRVGGSPELLAEVHIALGNLALQTDGAAAAKPHAEKARGAYAANADGNADLLLLEARIADSLGQTADAAKAYSAAVGRYKAIKNHGSTATALYYQASFLSRQGDRPAARLALTEALELDRRMENQLGILVDLRALAVLETRDGNVEAAYSLLVRAFGVSSGMTGTPQRTALLADLAANRDAAGDAAAAEAWRNWKDDSPVNEFLGTL